LSQQQQPLHVVFLGLTHGNQRRTVSWSTDRTETPNTVPCRHRPLVGIGPQDIGSSDSTNDAAATRRSASALTEERDKWLEGWATAVRSWTKRPQRRPTGPPPRPSTATPAHTGPPSTARNG